MPTGDCQNASVTESQRDRLSPQIPDLQLIFGLNYAIINSKGGGNMNKLIQHLFLFEKFEIQTKMSKKEIIKKVSSFADPEYTDYYGSVSEDGFFIAEKNRKHFVVGRTQNSFAPTAKARIEEKDGYSTVSGVLRMNILVLILFAPIYLFSLLLIIPFPIMLIILHFAFFKPVKRLKEKLYDLLLEKDM